MTLRYLTFSFLDLPPIRHRIPMLQTIELFECILAVLKFIKKLKKCENILIIIQNDNQNRQNVKMIALNENDRLLISALKKDSRASITTLSASLGLSRATVQIRLERLIRNGVIRRFTIELEPEAEGSLVRAVATIEIQGSNADSIIKSLNQMLGIVAVYTTNGAWDLVAQIETFSLAEFDLVLRQIREVKGILNSESSILLGAA